MSPLSDDQAESLRRSLYNATVVTIRPCTPGLWILRVRPDAALGPYHPGQYTTLGLGAWEPRVDSFDRELIRPAETRSLIRRAYSFCHPILDAGSGDLARPESLDFHEFYVMLLTGSAEGDFLPHLTPRLFRLAEGDRIHLGRKVAGRYTLEGVGAHEDVVFAATGTGEAPHNAMIWQLLRSGHRGRIGSVLCTRYAADQGYRDLHRRLQERYTNYTYIALTTREPCNGRKLYLQEFIGDGYLESALGWKLEPERAHVYLCGNSSMIGIPKTIAGRRVFPSPEGLIEILERRGFRAEGGPGERVNIHFEKYW
jgi:ferredoxin--NADP+ reductase